jgi:hypothetical protein
MPLTINDLLTYVRGGKLPRLNPGSIEDFH